MYVLGSLWDVKIGILNHLVHELSTIKIRGYARVRVRART